MPKHKRRVNKQPPTILILAGIALLLVAVFAFKNDAPVASSTSLESQLDDALREKHPTFVFLHSLECIPCKEMMGTVAVVYPEFQDAVSLIDVDIYDPVNENILRRENLHSIPTLVFYDSQGNREVFIGAMPAPQFRAALQALAGN